MSSPPTKPTTSNPPAKWTIVDNFLGVDQKTSESIDKGVCSFIKNEEYKTIAINAVKGKVSEDLFKGLSAFSKAVAYDGFNPQTIIIELASKAAADRRDDAGSFEFEADGVKYLVPKRCSLSRDVQMLVTLFLVRGNNLFKILKTVSKEAKVAISHKIAAYSIKSDDDADAAARRRKERVILGSKDITLSRIAASFPHITLAVAKQISIPGKANCVVIQAQASINGGGKPKHQMPVILQHGLLPALLMKTQPQEESALKAFCYMFNLEQTITLQHPNVKKQMLNEPLANQLDNCVKFVEAAINGPMTSDRDRGALLRGLISGDKAAVDEWVTAGADAWIKASVASSYSSLVMQATNELSQTVAVRSASVDTTKSK